MSTARSLNGGCRTRITAFLRSGSLLKIAIRARTVGIAGIMGSMRSFMKDASVEEQQIKPGSAKRVLRFAAPYAGQLAVFLSVVILSAGIGIVNPLIYRHIINDGILKGDAALIIRFAVLAGVLGLLDTALGLAQSYF